MVAAAILLAMLPLEEGTSQSYPISRLDCSHASTNFYLLRTGLLALLASAGATGNKNQGNKEG